MTRRSPRGTDRSWEQAGRAELIPIVVAPGATPFSFLPASCALFKGLAPLQVRRSAVTATSSARTIVVQEDGSGVCCVGISVFVLYCTPQLLTFWRRLDG